LIVNALSAPPTESKVLLAKAISFTNKANSNPIFADKACSLWTEALQDKNLVEFAETMHALFASVLARVGRDREALIEYEKSLKLLEESGATSKSATKAEIDIRLGKGKCLQRLLLYDEARNTFIDASNRCGRNGFVGNSWESTSSSESLRRAALCSMRLGDLKSAINTLNRDEKYLDPETAGMLGGLCLLRESSSFGVSKNNEQSSKRALELLHFAIDKSYSPLFDWLYCTNEMKQQRGQTVLFTSLVDRQCDIFLLFADVNNSPFDDSDLIQLDDKILLHSLMTRTPFSKTNSKNFWPTGFVLPDDYNSFYENHIVGSSNNENGCVKWMLKDRAGYGSHGNRVASVGDIYDLFSSEDYNINPKDSILCQRIVDPPMTINGRKFSLRIYVVYFPPYKQNGIPAGIYLSSLGLVKFAFAVYDGKSAKFSSIGDQYMTNSGRGNGRSSDQRDLEYLRMTFERNSLDYDEMWEKIKCSVKTVMREFLELKNDQSNHSKATQGNYQPFGTLPKVLGFDFMIDAFQNPWLLEVNRFPGLEPRSNLDSDVKHAVIYDAWVAAAKRIGAPVVFGRGFCRPSISKDFSLEELSM
ncbi:hypothetical protein ACHAXS_001669, partial [Conticribra weissflogii]